MSRKAECSAQPLPSMGDADPDALFQCPYDSSHRVSAARFPYHLNKCAQSHQKEAQRMRTCPFNARHRIPKTEMAAHVAQCPDRRVTVPEVAHDVAQKGPSLAAVPLQSWQAPPSQEDWDAEVDENAPFQPYIWGTSAMAPSTTRNSGASAPHATSSKKKAGSASDTASTSPLGRF